MEHLCVECNYRTKRKYDFVKHCKSKKHLMNVEETEEKEFICEKCGVHLKRQYNLKKHMEICKTTLNDRIKELETECRRMKKKYKQQKKIINSIKTNNAPANMGTINGDNNNNMTVKKYIRKYYIGAPALEEMKGYTLTNKDLEELAFHYKQDTIGMYLGRLLISNYKKEDPKDQSLWTSDVSRLTFLVSRMLHNRSTIWVKDNNGETIRTIVLNNLLGIIHNSIKTYMAVEDNIDIYADDFEKKNEMKMNLLLIQVEIEQKKLEDKILKYIAPKFILAIEELKGKP